MKKTSLLIRAELSKIQALIADDIASARKAQDAVGALEAKMLSSSKITYLSEKRLSDAEYAIPAVIKNDCVILYLHGGAYTAGDLAYAKGFGGILADATKLNTLCLAYRLAPEHPFPAALEDALAAYRLLLEQYPAEKIVFTGESAGGGLCYALCLAAREHGLPMPRCVVTISPWTDLSLSFPAHERNAAVDPTLTRHGLDLSANMYAGERRENPLVSPVFGKLAGFPPTLIIAGNCEILEDDSIEMAKRLCDAGVHCELHIENDAWHAYVLYGIYEARQALKLIAEFIERQTKC